MEKKPTAGVWRVVHVQLFLFWMCPINALLFVTRLSQPSAFLVLHILTLQTELGVAVLFHTGNLSL